MEPSFDLSYNEERVIIFSNAVKSKHSRQPIMKANKQVMGQNVLYLIKRKVKFYLPRGFDPSLMLGLWFLKDLLK